VNRKKVLAIEEKIEKLLKVEFIYLFPLTERVSNPVPVTKKDGSI